MAWTPAEAVSPASPADDSSDARGDVEAYFQSLVDAGLALWVANSAGYSEFHLKNGDVYLFGELGITRLRKRRKR